MKENYIKLEAYVNGQPIHWELNPAPKTLHNEIYEFAGSICELCKIIIRNQIITDKPLTGISVMLFCEGYGIPCASPSFNKNTFLMTNDSFRPRMFGYQLDLTDAIAAAVVSEAKFINQ